MSIKLDPPLPQQRYPRTLPELLTAVAELLTRHQPHDVPGLRIARTVQQVTRAEFHILDILGFELATPSPAAWVEIFRRRLSFWQQKELLQPPDLLAPAVFGVYAHHIAEAHVQCFFFNAGSTASQVRATASFVFHCICGSRKDILYHSSCKKKTNVRCWDAEWRNGLPCCVLL